MRRFLNPLTLIVSALTVLAVSGAIAGSTPTAGKTLANLQEAFNGESNAHARYLAFAEKADQEGSAKVASIFRAAARAESIHAANHAEVITSMGAKPTARVEAPAVKTTADNLKAAIEGESYERDTMYPEFIAAAKAEGSKAALRSFNFAVDAEGGHAKLYADALQNLESMGGKGLELYVCPVCGRTELKLAGEKCPTCFTENAKFIKVG